MTAVVYFSRNGENLIHGEKKILLKGNTAQVGEKIAQKLQVPTYELTPRVTYPDSYEEVVRHAEIERVNQSFPSYQLHPVKPSGYRHLFLGFPNWWGSFPRIIASFLRSESFEGVVIYPFCTHEGSGMGSSVEEIRMLCPESIVIEGLPIRGSRVEKSNVAITHWLTHYYWNQK